MQQTDYNESSKLDVDEQRLREALRFSLLTLTSLTDKIKELAPLKNEQPTVTNVDEQTGQNLLDQSYSRPWWPALFAFGSLYVLYRFFYHSDD